MKMKKNIFFICPIIILLMIVGCSSTETETKATARPTEQVMENVLDIEVTLPDNIGLNEIAGEVFEKYLIHLKEQKTPESQRIKDYLINSIKIEKSNDMGFEFSVFYSILPDSERYILAGNGDKGDDGWITGKFYFVDVSKSDKTYRITQLATGK
ncbi:hypothetical protein [Desulfosporosinus sp. OT]|uniref:hypothetical protein n=1 Tax=Desulfosporosinus sp. OT TaxID=913865 RepID=UPI000223AD1D|nr:hypothetical protein [Desulfosporosinus sp. OT]EGW41085.1 hypothetical protein DOT_0972 [Desulfosporosinus sp. OT]